MKTLLIWFIFKWYSNCYYGIKNQLTGQNYKHSENQYRFDRDPKEPLSTI